LSREKGNNSETKPFAAALDCLIADNNASERVCIDADGRTYERAITYRYVAAYCHVDAGSHSHIHAIALQSPRHLWRSSRVALRTAIPGWKERFDVPVNFRNAGGKLDMNGSLYQWKYYEALPY
jgi:hypothetical protein